MTTRYKQWLHWLPRVLSVSFILFISLFALDVFGEDDDIIQIAIGLFMHLIPTYLLIGAVYIAWRYRMIGGLLFFLLGLVSVLAFRTDDAHPLTFLLISLPPMLIGLMYISDGVVSHHQPPQSAAA